MAADILPEEVERDAGKKEVADTSNAETQVISATPSAVTLDSSRQDTRAIGTHISSKDLSCQRATRSMRLQIFIEAAKGGVTAAEAAS